MSKRKKKPTITKFKVGDKVRVNHGVEDVDYPDMPLGGWAGTVTEVQGADRFTLRWTEETTAAIHPVFKQRCEIDGLDPEKYVLTGDDYRRIWPSPSTPSTLPKPAPSPAGRSR